MSWLDLFLVPSNMRRRGSHKCWSQTHHAGYSRKNKVPRILLYFFRGWKSGPTWLDRIIGGMPVSAVSHGFSDMQVMPCWFPFVKTVHQSWAPVFNQTLNKQNTKRHLWTPFAIVIPLWWNACKNSDPYGSQGKEDCQKTDTPLLGWTINKEVDSRTRVEYPSSCLICLTLAT